MQIVFNLALESSCWSKRLGLHLPRYSYIGGSMRPTDYTFLYTQVFRIYRSECPFPSRWATTSTR